MMGPLSAAHCLSWRRRCRWRRAARAGLRIVPMACYSRGCAAGATIARSAARHNRLTGCHSLCNTSVCTASGARDGHRNHPGRCAEVGNHHGTGTAYRCASRMTTASRSGKSTAVGASPPHASSGTAWHATGAWNWWTNPAPPNLTGETPAQPGSGGDERLPLMSQLNTREGGTTDDTSTDRGTHQRNQQAP